MLLKQNKRIIPPLPPKHMRNHSDEQFLKSASSFVENLKRLVDLEPKSVILDSGCASGRLAFGLMGFLGEDSGQYYGFDLRKDRIDWCNSNIATNHKNYHFEHYDIYSKSLVSR